MKQIKFNVKAHTELGLMTLKPFQGRLKKLPEENYQKLRAEIVEDGFNFAPHVWVKDKDNFILDGHQRLSVLRRLAKEGYDIDLVPCNTVYAHDYDNAKRKVLQSVSQYGKIDKDGYDEFTKGLDLQFENFDFPDVNFDPVPDFGAGTEDDQGKLDTKKPKICPECGYEM
jgi:hypothetical protein